MVKKIIIRIWGDDDDDLFTALLRLFVCGAAAGAFIGVAIQKVIG